MQNKPVLTGILAAAVRLGRRHFTS
jgi:hypothetical protein